jgi:hypothetical protein
MWQFFPSRRFSLINWQHFWLFKKKKKIFPFFFPIVENWNCTKRQHDTHAGQQQTVKTNWYFVRAQHKLQV